MNQEQLKNILEAALMVASEPLNLNRLLVLFDKEAEPPEREMLLTVLAELQQDYQGRGIELCEVASGYRFQARADYADWVNRLFDERPPRYSRALLETLAIIAYRQPITRGEIEDIRGVSVNSNIIKTLQEREWIRTVGHRDVPGKPELLATTRQFLDYFNLKKLSDLPTLAEIKDFENINPDLFDSLAQMPSPPVAVEVDLEQPPEEEVDASAEDVQGLSGGGDQEPDEGANVIPFSG